MRKRPDELLAAYADGGLTPDEAAAVESLLAESPEARGELEAIRRLLAEARQSGPLDADEPDWDEMARAIHTACDAAPPRRLAWLWQPRRLIAIGALAASAASAIGFIALRHGDGGGGTAEPSAAALTEPRATAPAGQPPLTTTTEGDQEPDALPALREPEVDELSPTELAELDDELEADDLGDQGFIADLLDPSAGGAGGDDDLDLDVFDDDTLTADELAEDLPPDGIEKLDRFLAEVSAG